MAAIEVWKQYLHKAGIKEEQAEIYADSFVKNELMPESASELDRGYLEELGVKTLGHTITITKLAKQMKKTKKAPRPLSAQTTLALMSSSPQPQSLRRLNHHKLRVKCPNQNSENSS